MSLHESYLRSLLVAVAIIALTACGGGSTTPESAKPSPAQSPAGSDVKTDTGTAPGTEKNDVASQLPPGHPPIDGRSVAGSIAPPEPGAGTGDKAMVWTAPKDWIAESPASPMRRAQYKVPGPGGDGECLVFYFGPGQGGEWITNANRWARQFKKPDGTPPSEKIWHRQIGGFNVTFVEIHGTYDAGQAMGAPADKKPGYMLLATIAEGPDANWFFKLTGPETTVLAQRDAFDAMMNSLKAGA